MEKQHISMRSKETIDEKRFVPKFCKQHGWYEAGIKEPNGIRWFAGCPVCRREKNFSQALSESMIPKRYLEKRVSNFIADSTAQKEALDRCKKFSDEIEKNINNGLGLLLIGSPGTGKTHMACALLYEALSKGKTGLYISAGNALAKIKATWTSKSVTQEQVFSELTVLDILVVDEIGALSSITPREKDLLFELINARYEAMKSTIFISNLNLKGTNSIEDYLEERSFDRICEVCPAVIFRWPSFRRNQDGKKFN